MAGLFARLAAAVSPQRNAHYAKLLGENLRRAGQVVELRETTNPRLGVEDAQCRPQAATAAAAYTP